MSFHDSTSTSTSSSSSSSSLPSFRVPLFVLGHFTDFHRRSLYRCQFDGESSPRWEFEHLIQDKTKLREFHLKTRAESGSNARLPVPKRPRLDPPPAQPAEPIKWKLRKRGREEKPAPGEQSADRQQETENSPARDHPPAASPPSPSPLRSLGQPGRSSLDSPALSQSTSSARANQPKFKLENTKVEKESRRRRRAVAASAIAIGVPVLDFRVESSARARWETSTDEENESIEESARGVGEGEFTGGRASRSSSGGDWEVSKILAHRSRFSPEVVDSLANYEFLIRWRGFSADQDTWEPGENITECEELVKKYKKEMNRLGEENRQNRRVEKESGERKEMRGRK